MQQGEWIADGDAQRYLLGRMVELVSQKSLENLAAALLLALASSCLALGATCLIQVVQSPEEAVFGRNSTVYFPYSLRSYLALFAIPSVTGQG